MATTRMLRKPIHRFLRNPNKYADEEVRAWSRRSAFENTLKILEDPATGKKLYLVGTTHGSTTLANRTKKLIQDLKPDTVLVQTTKEWADLAAQVEVTNQREMTDLNSEFKSLAFYRPRDYNFRGVIFQLRWLIWTSALRLYSGFPTTFHPFQPGLEIKNAVEAAQEVGSEVVFAGTEFDETALKALEQEKRLDLLGTTYRFLSQAGITTYITEEETQKKIISVVGPEAYSEYLDDYGVNWWIKWFERVSPYQKTLIVDNRDDRLFDQILNEAKGDTVVAVVNHHHLPGLEHRWRFNTNTEVKTRRILNF